MKNPEFVLVAMLRVIGVSALFAIPAMCLPYNWMNAIHQYLGLGVMPDTPIVSYLARSLSMFYAMMGVILLALSMDIRRFHSLVTLFGYLWIVTGLALLGIDIYSKMPWSWTIGEGPFTALLGVVVLWLQRLAARRRLPAG